MFVAAEGMSSRNADYDPNLTTITTGTGLSGIGFCLFATSCKAAFTFLLFFSFESSYIVLYLYDLYVRSNRIGIVPSRRKASQFEISE